MTFFFFFSFLPEFEIITWAFGKFPIVITLWVGMVGCTMFIIYPMFSYWAAMRPPGKCGKFSMEF
jgi:hypothetical protein